MLLNVSLLEPFAFVTSHGQSPFNNVTKQTSHSLFVQCLLGNMYVGDRGLCISVTSLQSEGWWGQRICAKGQRELQGRQSSLVYITLASQVFLLFIHWMRQGYATSVTVETPTP